MQINRERLNADINDLSKIGKTKDGITRPAFSDEDMEARAWLITKINQSGLELCLDSAGNIRGRLTGGHGAPVVACGSHIDTVNCAGHLDGALGVLAGLEALRTLQESKVRLSHPVEVIAFSDEEGRFGGMLGSRALAGTLSEKEIQTATDMNGIRLHDCLIKRGLDPKQVLSAKEDPRNLKAFIELHIEQGPVLEEKQIPIGIVTAITGLFKWEISIKGQANHAGTTPMNMRRDAFQGMVAFAAQIEALLKAHGSSDSKTTIGKVEVLPGSPNVVPGDCHFTLEARDTDQSLLRKLETLYQKTLEDIAKANSLTIKITPLSEIDPVLCTPEIINLISSIVEEQGEKAFLMPSGAAHDAQNIAEITKMGMIFVPSINGISHSPLENTAMDDIETGTNLLTKTLYELAR